MRDFKKYLKEKLNYEITDDQLKQFEIYFSFLIEYNEKVNLTRIVEKKEVYIKHFIDSLLIIDVVDFNSKTNLLDMGSGPGFPAVPIKILYPHLEVLLVDARNKKVIFLNKLIDKLNLTNIKAIHARLENLKYKNYFEVVTARALGSLELIGNYAYPLMKKEGIIISYKGSNYKEELEEFKTKFDKKLRVEKIDKKDLPEDAGFRTNIIIRKV